MDELLTKAEAFVRARAARFPSALRYHTVDHMAEVAQAAKELAKQAGLDKGDALALRLAAWFHDSAYDLGAEGHEQRGAELAADFLRGEQADPALVERVKGLVLATSGNANAEGPLEAMIKDADLVHIARPTHMDELELLRQELEVQRGKKLKKKAWLAENLAFLERTTFRCEAARTLWNEGRERNLAAMREAMHERAERKEQDSAEKAQEKEEKERRAKSKETERGVDTLFRVTLANHMRLSQVADRKAGTLLSVNALIISLSMSRLTPKVSQHPELYIPLFMLMGVCVLTIVFATLATRPKISHGTTSKEAIARKEANLLFFGNFHGMSYPDFDAGMRQVMEDRDYLYGSLTRDLYGLGKVLDRKYRLLRITYNIFMFGIVGVVALMVYVTVVFGSSF